MAIEALLRSTQVPVTVVRAAMSNDKLVALTDQFVAGWLTRFPEILGIDVDAADGMVTLDVSSRGQEIAGAVQKDLAVFGVAVGWRSLDGSAGVMRRGGFIIDDGCTVGFSVVRDDGVRATTTASHCSNEYRWRNFQDGNWQVTSFMTGVHSSNADIQASRTPLNPQPLFYASSTESYRDVLSSIARADMDGNAVCHRGVKTGYSCGEVESIVYRPTWADACGGEVCDAEWPRVEGPDLACDVGDSGGPVFLVNTAYGLLAGGSTRGTANGDCNYFVFTPIGKFHQLDLHLLKQ